ncbi:MAG: flavodoxin-dependent (E)-4-hydroxy-3-methylbut-2-enyl-diphosphate synthase [Anaerovorax sp.]
MMYHRNNSKGVNCGSVPIGGGAPISIQSMTNTDTRDVQATLRQIGELEEAGCQIIRCAIPDMEAAQAFGEIKKRCTLPMVADIHFDYRLAVAAIKNGADKVRINPGNIGDTERIRAVVAAAKEHQIPIRVGVNAGSLEKDILKKYQGVTAEGIVESALQNIQTLEEMDFEDMVVSVKASDVVLSYESHLLLAEKIPYPIHVGITEAGTADSGKVKSAIGIGAILLAGIGDTMRVSLTGNPVNEVLFAKEILKSLKLTKGGIHFVSCPTCGRCTVDLETMARRVEGELQSIEKERDSLGLKPLTVAVMGCEVNGPGEAKSADIGVACGRGKGVIFKQGIILETVKEEEIVARLLRYIREETL